MNYQEFEQSFSKANKFLKISLGVSWTIGIVLVALLFFQRKYFLYRGGNLFEERPLAEEICRLGFVGLAQGSPNPHVVDSEVIKLSQKENFSVPIDKIFLVKSLEVGACKVILKSEGILTAFKIKLHENDMNPFYYKVIQLDEVVAKED